MLELNKQVCSLELAKKLKELGVKQESLFYWMHHPEFGWQIRNEDKSGFFVDFEHISAFTVSELGEMLPIMCRSGKNCGKDKTREHHEEYKCLFLESKRIVEYAETEADSRAKMLIYLIKNDLLDLDNLIKLQYKYVENELSSDVAKYIIENSRN